MAKLTGQLGPDADMSIMQQNHTLGLNSDINACNFQVGARVVLFKLAKRPELNGRIGTVVKVIDARTKRIGVALDEGGAQAACPPVAVLMTNIMMMRH